MIQIKRAYEPPTPSDGTRVLVDGLWPRGVRKEAARIDAWRRDLAPSASLRTWYGHDPAKFDRFRTRYRAELAPHAEALGELARLGQRGTLTLVFGARDAEHSNAAVLKELLEELAR